MEPNGRTWDGTENSERKGGKGMTFDKGRAEEEWQEGS